MPISDRRAVGCEKKTLETLNKRSPLSEYRKLKIEAGKAMRESVGSGYRVPNTRWSGYYFSHTSPAPINLNDNNSNDALTPDKAWNRSDLVRPKIAEPVVSPPQAPVQTPPNSNCRYQQLLALLRDEGLHKYIDLFKKHELDMSTFTSLNEADLIEIGVTAFGARRKMLLLIADLKASKNNFPVSSGGAERKMVGSPSQFATLPQDKW